MALIATKWFVKLPFFREGGGRGGGGSSADFFLLFLALTSCAAGAFTLGLTRNSWMVWLYVGLGSFKLVPQPVLRSMMSKAVPTSFSSSSSSSPSSSSFGSLFAIIGVIDSTTNLFVGAIFSFLYAETLHWLPGFVWILLGSFFVAGFLVVIVLRLKYGDSIGRGVNRGLKKPQSRLGLGEASA